MLRFPVWTHFVSLELEIDVSEDFQMETLKMKSAPEATDDEHEETFVPSDQISHQIT